MRESYGGFDWEGFALRTTSTMSTIGWKPMLPGWPEDDWSRNGIEQLDQLWEAIGWTVRGKELWLQVIACSSWVLLVWDRERLIAFGRIVSDGVFVTFYDIAVHPDYQKRGIGTKLMEALIDEIKDGQYAGIYLFRWDKNPSNKAFYEKFGFVDSRTGMELVSLMSPE